MHSAVYPLLTVQFHLEFFDDSYIFEILTLGSLLCVQSLLTVLTKVAAYGGQFALVGQTTT